MFANLYRLFGGLLSLISSFIVQRTVIFFAKPCNFSATAFSLYQRLACTCGRPAVDFSCKSAVVCPFRTREKPGSGFGDAGCTPVSHYGRASRYAFPGALIRGCQGGFHFSLSLRLVGFPAHPISVAFAARSLQFLAWNQHSSTSRKASVSSGWGSSPFFKFLLWSHSVYKISRQGQPRPI